MTASKEALSITMNKPLPEEIGGGLLQAGAGTLVSLPQQLIIMGLMDMRPSDIATVEGPARFRVGLAENFMIISPMYKGLSFDIIWSPVIAKLSGEPPMEKPIKGQHPLFNFVLIDGHQVVRSIRSATISEEVAMAIWRAQGELSAKNIQQEDLHAEMMDVFGRYPSGIPEGFFHEVCDFGD
jgi:hypothetical protein